MTQAVIDTLQLADRLKESGFQDRQAEGLARALGHVFADHVVTKADLDSAVQLIRADYRTLDEKSGNKLDALDEKFETRLDALDEKSENKLDALDEKFEARLDALDAKFETKLDALDAKFEARFNSLSSQIRFIFAALAMLLALGLIDTVPRLIG